MIELLYLLFLLFLANVGERRRFVWHLTLLLLGATNVGVMLLGLGILLTSLASSVSGPPSPFFTPRVGVILFATGLLAFLPLLAGVRRVVGDFLPLDPQRPVHTTALVYAVYLVGGAIAQFAADVSAQLSLTGVQLTQVALWLQGLFFVATSLVGVGFPVRRSLRATLRRLGVKRLTGDHVRLALVAVVGLEVFDYAVSLAWFTADPDSYRYIAGLNETLFGRLMNPAGAITVGLTAGVGEELLFRGALQPRFGLWITAALFALVHTQYALSPALLEVFIIGIVLGLIRERSSTTTAILVHALYNAVNVLLFPFWPGSP